VHITGDGSFVLALADTFTPVFEKHRKTVEKKRLMC